MATKAMIFTPALAGIRYDGAALSGGTLTFYEPGTTTLRAVYTTRNKTVQAANPFTLDSDGRGEVFLDGVYDILPKTLAGASKPTWDGYEGSSGAVYSANLIAVDTVAGNVAKTMPTDADEQSYVKKSASDNAYVVTFTTSDGSQLAEPSFQIDAENVAVTFKKLSNVWYRMQ